MRLLPNVQWKHNGGPSEIVAASGQRIRDMGEKTNNTLPDE